MLSPCTSLEILGWVLTHEAAPVGAYIVEQKRHLPSLPASGRGQIFTTQALSDDGVDRVALEEMERKSHENGSSTGAGPGAGAGAIGPPPDCIQLTRNSSLFSRVIWCILDAKDEGIQTQAADVLRMLLNTGAQAGGVEVG